MAVSIRETVHVHRGCMSYQSAAQWNEHNPPGTAVKVTLVDGSTFSTSTRTAAIQWGPLAMLELEGRDGYWTVHALEPLELLAAAHTPQAQEFQHAHS